MTSINEHWIEIFDKYDILHRVKVDGCYFLTARKINEFKEARLMTKWDQRIHMPLIFRKNHLSILPTKRGEYVIGPFETHRTLHTTMNLQPKTLYMPPLETLKPSNLYSEASALLYAYNSGLFQDFLSQEAYLTLNGRMGSGAFSFDVESSLPKRGPMRISVDSAQIEIDAGIETEDGVYLVEAKNTEVTDFIIRQLYYPYRTWERQSKKPVESIFLTYSDDYFHVHLYRFHQVENYSSLSLIRSAVYSTVSSDILMEEVVLLWRSIVPMPENSTAPFPQADRFSRVLDMMTILKAGPQTVEEIQLQFMLDGRQVYYYLSACAYLGFSRKLRGAEGERLYALTPDAEQGMALDYRKRTLFFMERILRRSVMHEVFGRWLVGGKPDLGHVQLTMEKHAVRTEGSTTGRRGQTVLAWVGWVFDKVQK